MNICNLAHAIKQHVCWNLCNLLGFLDTYSRLRSAGICHRLSANVQNTLTPRRSTHTHTQPLDSTDKTTPPQNIDRFTTTTNLALFYINTRKLLTEIYKKYTEIHPFYSDPEGAPTSIVLSSNWGGGLGGGGSCSNTPNKRSHPWPCSASSCGTCRSGPAARRTRWSADGTAAERCARWACASRTRSWSSGTADCRSRAAGSRSPGRRLHGGVGRANEPTITVYSTEDLYQQSPYAVARIDRAAGRCGTAWTCSPAARAGSAPARSDTVRPDTAPLDRGRPRQQQGHSGRASRACVCCDGVEFTAKRRRVKRNCGWSVFSNGCVATFGRAYAVSIKRWLATACAGGCDGC